MCSTAIELCKCQSYYLIRFSLSPCQKTELVSQPSGVLILECQLNFLHKLLDLDVEQHFLWSLHSGYTSRCTIQVLEATVLTRIPTLLLLLLFATQLQTSLLRTFRSACNPYGWYFSISSKWVPARTFWAIFYTSQYHHAILQSDLLVINIFLPSRVSTHREFLMLTLCMQAAHVSPDLEQRKNPSCGSWMVFNYRGWNWQDY
jgi:hypothetical protein